MSICARTTTTKIRRHADKEHKKQDPKPRRQMNLCMLCIALIVCASVSIHVYLRICVCEGINAWVTGVRNHFTVISYSPETSGSRSCDGDNSLSQICFVFCYYYYLLVRSFTHTHTHTHTCMHAYTHTHTHTLKPMEINSSLPDAVLHTRAHTHTYACRSLLLY